MRRFTAVLARKSMAAHRQFGAMLGSSAVAPVFPAQRRLQRGQEENRVLGFDVSGAFDAAPHGAVALLLRHMGVPKGLIKLFHTLSCGSTLRIVTSDSATPSICLHQGLRQGSAESALLYLILLESLLRSLARRAQGDVPHGAALVQAYCDDLLSIALSQRQFPKYPEAIAQYLAGMGMSLNAGKYAYATTTHIPSITVHLDLNNAVASWVRLMAKSTVPYLGLRLDSKASASIKEKHVLCCEALPGWCKNTLGPVSVPHEVMVAVVGGIVRYAAPYLSRAAEEVVRLNATIETTALHFENLPKDLSIVMVRSGKGLRLADIRVVCRDSVVETMAELMHHRSAVIKGELRAILDDLHPQYGVCGQLMVPLTVFASHATNSWVHRVLNGPYGDGPPGPTPSRVGTSV